MTKPRGLGRGLDALLGGAPVKPAASHPDELRDFPSATSEKSAVNAVQFVGIQDIEANPNQPRREFDEAGLKELADSIEAHGIIQPVTLRKIRASKYQIISGERRFRACQRVGLTELPAYVREADDQSLLEMALVENIQREDLNPLEVGMSFRHLMEECQMTQRRLGQTRGHGPFVGGQLPAHAGFAEPLQAMLRLGTLSLGHAKTLAGVKGRMRATPKSPSLKRWWPKASACGNWSDG